MTKRNFKYEFGQIVCCDPTGQGQGITGKITGRTEDIDGGLFYWVSSTNFTGPGITRNYVSEHELCEAKKK